ALRAGDPSQTRRRRQIRGASARAGAAAWEGSRVLAMRTRTFSRAKSAARTAIRTAAATRAGRRLRRAAEVRRRDAVVDENRGALPAVRALVPGAARLAREVRARARRLRRASHLRRRVAAHVVARAIVVARARDRIAGARVRARAAFV